MAKLPSWDELHPEPVYDPEPVSSARPRVPEAARRRAVAALYLFWGSAGVAFTGALVPYRRVEGEPWSPRFLLAVLPLAAVLAAILASLPVLHRRLGPAAVRLDVAFPLAPRDRFVAATAILALALAPVWLPQAGAPGDVVDRLRLALVLVVPGALFVVQGARVPDVGHAWLGGACLLAGAALSFSPLRGWDAGLAAGLALGLLLLAAGAVRLRPAAARYA